jgi:hypothetical protein
MLAAVPGVSIEAQLGTIVLAALTIRLWEVKTVPAAIAVLTAHTPNAGSAGSVPRLTSRSSTSTS